MNNSQKTAETIEALAKEKGVPVSTILVELEMNKNALFTMKNSGYLPRVENLCKFADYFQCSLDYLVGRTGTFDSNLSPISNPSFDNTTEEFIQIFQNLDLPDRVAVMQFAFDRMKDK